MTSSADKVIQYHQQTKHQLNAYAKGPAALDWDDQPNQFRRFNGCETIALPQPGADLAVLFGDLDRPEAITAQPLTRESIGLLLELAFGLSAWKQFGPDRWALRCNPSSGNLHPTEVYLLCTDADFLSPGVYHYLSHDHLLQRRCSYTEHLLPAEVYIGLSSVHWREAWKYGERAFRYCQHDIGHALAGLSYAAGCLGWSIELCSEVSDADLAHWLGLERSTDFVAQEHEAADLFCQLRTNSTNTAVVDAVSLTKITDSGHWFGEAQRLSASHLYHWPIIDEVAEQTKKPSTYAERWQPPTLTLPTPSNNIAASSLIRQRRSAQQFNAKAAALPLADFQRILAAQLPNDKPPFTAWNWQPQVHLVLFAHRVEDLEPGVYLLPRSTQDITELQLACSVEFKWQTVPAPFNFYRLLTGNVKQSAKTLSCHQGIAGDSFFSLGMLARFAENIDDEPWRYRRLFWECGLIGQILYLEAEAAGVRGTGIGCFFDDAMHGVLGLQDNNWQSLYHFTVGEPLNDNRLQTLPAYSHLLRSTT